MALGATPREILKLVIGQSLALTGVGAGIGLAISIVAVRPLGMFLTPEVRTSDPFNFVAVAAALALVALMATISPALRAVRVDPVVALRE
jgi:ABC-type antimicrobial peptide transport system permease subunit